jgi:hypothetical protein
VGALNIVMSAPGRSLRTKGLAVNSEGTAFEDCVTDSAAIKQLRDGYGGVWRIVPDLDSLEASGDDFLVFQNVWDADTPIPQASWPALVPSNVPGIISDLYAETHKRLKPVGGDSAFTVDHSENLHRILLATFHGKDVVPATASVSTTHANDWGDEVAWKPVEYSIPPVELNMRGFGLTTVSLDGIRVLRRSYDGLVLLLTTPRDLLDGVAVGCLSTQAISVVWYTGEVVPYPANTIVLQANSSFTLEIYQALKR